MKNFSWIYYVAKRFSLVERKGISAFTSRLSVLGICLGVMTLIVVISVMNGFQREFIDAIMEVSSYHVRAENVQESGRRKFEEFLSGEKSVKSWSNFIEAESFAAADGKQSALLVRGVPADILERDPGFDRELRLSRGVFDLERTRTAHDDAAVLEPIVLGSALARSLDIIVGDEVRLYSIASDKALAESFSKPRRFFVAGVFWTGYADINAGYAFISIDAARDFFSGADEIYGIKLKSSSNESAFIKSTSRAFPECTAHSWREYNRSFFGALRIEKNMLLLLVLLIFLVVAINIFNSMRRIVFERRLEISTLCALGGGIQEIKNIFIMRGFITGIRGALPGLLLGMLVCVNIKRLFLFLSAAVFYAQLVFLLIFNPLYASRVQENPMFAVYGNIPARMYAHEVILITLFGILSAVVSSWLASRKVLNTPLSEVLHDE